MANIRAIDMLFLDDIFEMGGGYVLQFSDSTFAGFFAEELGINIGDQKYSMNGTSKAKRLRCLLQTVDIPTIVRTLNALWKYREAILLRSGQPDKIQNSRERFANLVSKLQGIPHSSSANQTTVHQNVTSSAPSANTVKELLAELLALSTLDPQPRGYAYERFLKRLFDSYGLEARDPFKLRDEQIDGSFQLSNETYLMEAKWQNPVCGIAELHAFHGKVEQKAAWTRGLFVSNSGFSDDGLTAFGRGKRVVCMDGLDIYEVLSRNLSLPKVLDRKIRHAAETGVLFARVRDLFLS